MIAVTGGTGLLGNHLVTKLIAAGEKVIIVHRPGSESRLPSGVIGKSGDILDYTSLAEAFNEVETVIHAAALVSFNPWKRKEILNVNVQGTHHVVNACLKAGVKNLIHISSVSALGRKSGGVTDENTLWTGDSSSDYAESKYLAELEIYRGAEEGLGISMINPSVILSASDSSRSSGALFDYVWREKKFYTDGLLNYVDARDVADVVYKLCKDPRPGEKFILSAGTIPFRDFFIQVAKMMNRRPPSIRVSSNLVWWVGWLEEVKALMLNREPLVTRLSARLAAQSYRYDSQKAMNHLELQFRSIEETISWCCREYSRNVKTNK